MDPSGPCDSAPPCRFFLQARCIKGSACPFSHERGQQSPDSVTALPFVTSQQSPVVSVDPAQPVFSVDVEAVASGKSHDDRAIAQIGLVDFAGTPIKNIYITPDCPVESYLTPLTGLTKELLEQKGIALSDALEELRNALPSNAVLVGQNIRKDVQWLELKEGTDFASMIDLAALFRVWKPSASGGGSFRHFGLDHEATCILGESRDGKEHDAVDDAVKSVALFRAYLEVQHDSQALEEMQCKLTDTPVAPSFAKLHPSWEGVCMGNRWTCTCGAPFLG